MKKPAIEDAANTVMASIRVPKVLWMQFRRLAFDQATTVQSELVEALRTHLKKKGGIAA